MWKKASKSDERRIKWTNLSKIDISASKPQIFKAQKFAKIHNYRRTHFTPWKIRFWEIIFLFLKWTISQCPIGIKEWMPWCFIISTRTLLSPDFFIITAFFSHFTHFCHFWLKMDLRLMREVVQKFVIFKWSPFSFQIFVSWK